MLQILFLGENHQVLTDGIIFFLPFHFFQNYINKIQGS